MKRHEIIEDINNVHVKWIISINHLIHLKKR